MTNDIKLAKSMLEDANKIIFKQIGIMMASSAEFNRDLLYAAVYTENALESIKEALAKEEQ